MEKKVYDMHDDFEESFWYVEVRNDLLDGLMEKLNLGENARIADLGCGTGRHYKTLSKHGRVTCIDNSKQAIDACKRRGAKDARVADVMKTGVKADSLDAACAMDLIEHLDDDKGFLEEMQRVLKTGGALVLTTPAFDFLWSVDDEMAHHKRRYTRKRLEKLAEDTGFKVNYISYRYFYIFLPSLIIFKLQKMKKRQTNSLEMTPGKMNNLLTRVMRRENRQIAKGRKYPFGVGIIAILKKV